MLELKFRVRVRDFRAVGDEYIATSPQDPTVRIQAETPKLAFRRMMNYLTELAWIEFEEVPDNELLEKVPQAPEPPDPPRRPAPDEPTRWVISMDGVYYQEMGGLGPIFGPKATARRFNKKRDAALQISKHYGFTTAKLEKFHGAIP